MYIYLRTTLVLSIMLDAESEIPLEEESTTDVEDFTNLTGAPELQPRNRNMQLVNKLLAKFSSSRAEIPR